MGPLYRTLLIGLFFTLVCVWGSYFAFMTYEKHNQEIVTLVDELENQKRIIVGLQRDLGEAAVKKGSVAVSVESDQKKLDSQVSLLKKHGLTGFSQHEIQTSSGANLRARRPNHTLNMDELSKGSGVVMHVISHTHWDREWYLSFETFRGRLVQLLDKVFKRIREDDDFKHFHLDGQMVPVDDYLQIREHYRSQIMEANLAGKLALGPWYVQPDEFLASSEALVRNLQYGIIKAEALGGASLVGYIPDSFGHISQMPQMLLGFGITNAVSGRGLEAHFPSEVWWEGPDGSRVLFIFLKKWYCNGLDMPGDKVQNHYWENKKNELQGAGATTSHLLLMNGCDHTSPDPNVGDLIAQASPPNMRVVHSNMDDYIELVQREIASKKLNLQTRKGELRSGVEGLTNTLSNKISQKQANWRRQTMLERWVEPLETIAWKLGGFNYDHDTIWYSWRLLLENHPHDSICGCSSEEVHRDVDMRFEKLRQVTNQISATSAIRAAQVVTRHRPTSTDGTKVVIFNPTNIPRKNEVVVVKVYGLSAASYMKATDSQGNEVAAHTIENRGSKWSYILPDVGFRQPRTESAVMVAIQVTVPSFGFEVYTLHPQGQPVPDPQGGAPIVTRDAFFHGIEENSEDNNKPQRKKHNNLRDINSVLDASAQSLLSQTAGVRDRLAEKEQARQKIREEREKKKQTTAAGGFEGHERHGLRRLLSAGEQMENEYLVVTVEDAGTISVQHKADGKTYNGVNKLEDIGDSGDQYAFRQSGGAQFSNAASTRKHPIRNFKTHSVAQVTTTLSGIEFNIFYILKRGSPRVDIRTEFVNKNNNHRVRALFPAHGARSSFADGQFEVIERHAGHHYWPQCKFVTVLMGESGFTVANRGLPEYQLIDSQLALTLLRGTDRIGDWGHFPVATAQDHGIHAMEYSFIPFSNKGDSTTMFGGSDLEGRKFNDFMIGLQPHHFHGFTPEVVVNVDESDLEILTRYNALHNNNNAQMPTELAAGSGPWHKTASEAMEPNSFFDIRPATLALSSVKKTETRDSIIVRFFNPYAKQYDGEVYVSALFNAKQVWECRLDEKRISELKLRTPSQGTGQYVAISVPPKKIITLEFM